MNNAPPTCQESAVNFDAANPDPWLEELLRRTPEPELARRALLYVLRGLLNEDHFVNSSGRVSADAPPGAWVAWHVTRGRVNTSELGTPGVLFIHEEFAAAAEEEPIVAITLKARAWKDSGYDPDGLFKPAEKVNSPT